MAGRKFWEKEAIFFTNVLKFVKVSRPFRGEEEEKGRRACARYHGRYNITGPT